MHIDSTRLLHKPETDRVQQITISGTVTLNDAFLVMDRMRAKLLIVMNEQTFLGLVSVGDIQRAIINNTGMNTNVEQIIRQDLILASPDDDFEEIKQTMQRHRLEFMPVVKDSRLVGVFFWEDLLEESHKEKLTDTIAVIMAGGMGVRLRPLTYIIPKPLLPIGNKAMIEEIIDRFVRIGIRSFHISVNYKKNMIKDHLEPIAEDMGISVDYIQEKKPLGTAGSLSLIDDIGSITKPFFVSNCDILLDTDLHLVYEHHVRLGNDITVVSVVKKLHMPYGTLDIDEDGDLQQIHEKPDLQFMINSGVYVINPQLVEYIPKNEVYHITDLIEDSLKQGKKVGVYPVVEESWKDIGEWTGYMKTMSVDTGE